ncbi:MAG: hypothetical protein JW712_11630 [Dehalococcoidales bacterium]|nr:hypothetical protein [Dehalococcoidales bacterium]
MEILAWILGGLSGLSGIMGLIVATESIPELADLPPAMDAGFWLLLAILLMLGCIASVNSRSGGYD